MPKARIKANSQSRSSSKLTSVITRLYANLGPTLMVGLLKHQVSARAVAVVRPAPIIIALTLFLCILSGKCQLHAYQEGSTQTIATITSATLTSIAIAPLTATLSVAGTQQYTATGTYSDGTQQDLTGVVTWSSSNVGVATVSATGLATGVASGSTTISAVYGGFNANTTLTVTGI